MRRKGDCTNRPYLPAAERRSLITHPQWGGKKRSGRKDKVCLARASGQVRARNFAGRGPGSPRGKKARVQENKKPSADCNPQGKGQSNGHRCGSGYCFDWGERGGWDWVEVWTLLPRGRTIAVSGRTVKHCVSAN